MAVKLPCSSVGAPMKYSNQGTLFVAPLPAPPPMGGGVFDGTGTWTLSNYDTSGRPIDWERDIQVGDTLMVMTPTGSQTVTVDAIAAGAETTVITVTQTAVDGILEDGQPTGVWKVTPSELPCPPTGP